jgi:hypothetical protein
MSKANGMAENNDGERNGMKEKPIKQPSSAAENGVSSISWRKAEMAIGVTAAWRKRHQAGEMANQPG